MATIKDLKRMCESYQDCNGCPLYFSCGGCTKCWNREMKEE